VKEHINVPGFPENVRFTSEMHNALANRELAKCVVQLNMLADGDEETFDKATEFVAKVRAAEGLSVDEMSVALQYLRDLPENQPMIEAES